MLTTRAISWAAIAAALAVATTAPAASADGLAARGIQLAQAPQNQPAAPAPQSKALPVFDIPQAGVSFQTGDTWDQAGQTFRLYGVQSCIRGTNFTNPAGLKTDCGEASLAYFAALIRDTKPRCTAIAKSGSPPVIYSVCAAHVGKTTLDLGTVLITQGFAFAAIDGNGKPINFQYAVAEGDAQKNKRGLWAAKDLPYPNTILMKAAGGPAGAH